MHDYQYAAIRVAGIALMVLGGLVGAAMCGDQYGRDHAAESTP